MHLEAFRVQNYKKIRDTDWISVRDLTVFVGKNEAGKSALLRGLSKLNPSDGEKYDGLKEFPRRRYTNEFVSQDWPVATGRFALSPEERQELAQICPALSRVKSATCTRSYSWKLEVEFSPSPALRDVTAQELTDWLQRAKQQIQDLVAPDGKGDVLGTMKTAIVNALSGVENRISSRGAGDLVSKAETDQVCNAISTNTNEQWQKDLTDQLNQDARALQDRALMREKLEGARKRAQDMVPRFIYFDRYDVIDSAVHVPTFASQAANNQGGPRVRATHCLFRHVGLDVSKLAQLGRHQPEAGEDKNVRRQVDERAILASSASNAMTAKFADWYEQRRHKFRYQADGNYFRIWVSDDLDPSEIELDQRSVGMQYFFSFFTVFLVEAEGAHANSILLLDEPGLHMHGTAQAKIVEFLRKLSADNQLLYSTHSPFMIDADHLECARAVYEAEDGTTRVSEDVWPRDRDCLFPLQAALGYTLAQTLFLSKRQLIVEGLTDLWLLKALNQALAKVGRTTLLPEIVVVPAAGITKLLPLASMLIGHGVEIVALLDGDEPGRREGKKLAEKLLADHDRRCLFVGDFADIPSAEIEDLFPESDYLSAVKEAYPRADLTFNAAEKGMGGVVSKVVAWFERKKAGRFEKWRPAAVLRDRILAAPDEVPSSTLEKIEKVFGAVNGLFSDSKQESTAAQTRSVAP